LGDSFTAGSQVDYEDCFVARLEALFRKDGRDVEILNGGVTSLSPTLEYRKLARFLDQGYTADMVVMMLDISDIQDESLRALEQPAGYWACAFRSSRIIQLLLTRRYRDARPGRFWTDPRAYWTELDRQSNPWIEDGLARCRKAILATSRLCSQRGIRLVLVVYPWQQQIKSPQRPSPQQTIFSGFSASHGIALLDLFPKFFALPDWDKYFIPGDCHWNKEGHDLVARAIYSSLRSGWKRREKL
jgi:lysophospholipase L1-like esterase